jgi:hypothetical protein
MDGAFSNQQHISWPIVPKEEQTAGWFSSKCHELEMLKVTVYRRFVRETFCYLTEMKGDESKHIDIWLMRAQITYWLQRCHYEREGIPLTDSFWRNYDAIMCGRIDRLDPLFRTIVPPKEEEEEAMATTATRKSPPAKIQKSQPPAATAATATAPKKQLPVPIKKPLPSTATSKPAAKPTSKPTSKASDKSAPTASKKQPKKGSLITYAINILLKNKKGLTAKEIVDRALANGYQSDGKTPWATLSSSIYRLISAGDKHWKKEGNVFTYTDGK